MKMELGHNSPIHPFTDIGEEQTNALFRHITDLILFFTYQVVLSLLWLHRDHLCQESQENLRRWRGEQGKWRLTNGFLTHANTRIPGSPGIPDAGQVSEVEISWMEPRKSAPARRQQWRVMTDTGEEKKQDEEKYVKWRDICSVSFGCLYTVLLSVMGRSRTHSRRHQGCPAYRRGNQN